MLWYVRYTHKSRYPAGQNSSSSPSLQPAPLSPAPLILRWNASCGMACAATISALYLNLVLNMFYNFEDSTRTHCTATGTYNFLPSISSCIGGFTRPIWAFCVVVYIWQRVLAGFVLHSLHVSCTGARYTRYTTARLCAHIGEQFFLVLLSVVSSSDNLFLHELGFAGFSLCGMLNMALTCYICSVMLALVSFEPTTPSSSLVAVMSTTLGCRKSRRRSSTPVKEVESILRARVFLSLCAAFCLVSAVFFFFAHNRTCVDYRYTWFALSEWLFVLSNIIFHFEGEMRELADVDLVWMYGSASGSPMSIRLASS